YETAPAPTEAVSTLAGSGTEGDAEGSGTAAQFNFPRDITVDASGNVYVADRDNHKIRKITPVGVVTTLAGSGTQGDAEGSGIAAQFNRPAGVAVDVDGNVYVADSGNDKIKKITPAGVVTTLAGSSTTGATDGSGTTAQFHFPVSVAVGADGNVYVADYNNHKIRKITPDGEVSTLAGSGTFGDADGNGTAAQFDGPEGVAVDADGNVYVADRENRKVRKITPTGEVSTLAGSGDFGDADGSGTAARFNGPAGVAVDVDGNVYVADELNNKIRKITPVGVVSTLAGSGTKGDTDGSGTIAQFDRPKGVAIDADGNVYVADTGNDKIKKITQD
ncbi:MAG: NHL repeat-containing protein, partial [Tunicatimonas sp.]|uniref:NHL repeat-containing protein n=1 Tax=Tunicatimonas sp. TaxID=1940096 RepID=UPI003C7386B6